MSDNYDDEKKTDILVFKEESDNKKAPNFTGYLKMGEDLIEAIENGDTEFRVALWKTKTKNGKLMLAGSAQLPFKKDDEEPEEAEETDEFDDDDDF